MDTDSINLPPDTEKPQGDPVPLDCGPSEDEDEDELDGLATSANAERRGRATKARPWGRLKDETSKAYAAFSVFLGMDPTARTLPAVGKAIGKRTQVVSKWSRENRWLARAKAFDTQNAVIAQNVAEKVMRSQVSIWAERRLELRTEEWNLARELIAEARESLKLLRTKAVHHRLPEIARAAEIASKLARLAAEMPTQIEDVHSEHLHSLQIVGTMGRILQSLPPVADAMTGGIDQSGGQTKAAVKRESEEKNGQTPQVTDAELVEPETPNQ